MSFPVKRFTWLHPKLDKPMGGANFVLLAASRLKKFADVQVITQKTSSSMQERFAELGVSLVSLESPTFTDTRFWLSYEGCLRKDSASIAAMIAPGDIVISSMYPMNVIASRLGHNDIQVIYEPFSMFHDRDYVRNFGPAAAMFLGLMRKLHIGEEVAVTRAAKTRLTLSSREAQSIGSIYGADASVIYEGVDTEIFNRNVAPDPEFSDKTVILHSTGFDRYKGTDLVIAAMPDIVLQVPGAQLVVTYTREDSGALNRYRRSLDEAGILRNVLFLGTVPYDRLPGLNKAATLYVEPGWDRAMSLSVKEAMACGTPVVRGAAGLEEVTDGVEGFLISPDDLPGYVDRVVRLLTDKALRNRMAQAAAMRVTQQFTWTAVANRIAEHSGFVSTEMREAV